MNIGIMISPLNRLSNGPFIYERQKQKLWDFLMYGNMIEWTKAPCSDGGTRYAAPREIWSTKMRLVTNSERNTYDLRMAIQEHNFIKFDVSIFYDEGPDAEPDYVNILKSKFLILLPKSEREATNYRFIAERNHIPYGVIYPEEGGKF